MYLESNSGAPGEIYIAGYYGQGGFDLDRDGACHELGDVYPALYDVEEK